MSTQSVSIAGSGLVFDNTFGSGVTNGFVADVDAAEEFYESEFNNPVTLNMSFSVGGLPQGVVASNGAAAMVVSYAQLKAALIAKATTNIATTAATNLPATDPSGGKGFTLPDGYAKMLGLYSGNSDLDTITLGGNLGFNLNTESPDVVSTLEHEISEGAMGRVGGLGLVPVYEPGDAWAPMDLFRYNAAGQLDDSGGLDGQASYFGIAPGQVETSLEFNGANNQGTIGGYDFADWFGTNGTDSYGDGGPGDVGHVGGVDMDIMNALGWSNSGDWQTQNTNPREFGTLITGQAADLVAFGNAGVYEYSFANGVGTPVFALNSFGALAGGWSNQQSFPRLLGDVTGNGLDDIVAFGNAGVYEALSTGNGSYGAVNLVFSGFGSDLSAGGWTDNNIYPREIGDATGNGRDDIVAFGNAGVYEALANTDGTFQAPSLAYAGFGADLSAGGWTDNTTYPRMLGDVTGNGRDDIVAFGNEGVYVSLANANGTFSTPLLALSGLGTDASAGGWTSNDTYPRMLADVTGNGRDDIVAFGNAGVYVALANANGTFQAPFLALSALGTNAGFTSNDIYPREMADVNGDGRADIVAFANNGAYVALANANGTFQAPVFEINNFGAFSAL